MSDQLLSYKDRINISRSFDNSLENGYILIYSNSTEHFSNSHIFKQTDKKKEKELDLSFSVCFLLSSYFCFSLSATTDISVSCFATNSTEVLISN